MTHAEHNEPSNRVLLEDLLKTLGGVLLVVSLGLSGWALKEIQQHESRLVRVETKTEEIYRVLSEIRSDLKEIKLEIKKGSQ